MESFVFVILWMIFFHIVDDFYFQWKQAYCPIINSLGEHPVFFLKTLEKYNAS